MRSISRRGFVTCAGVGLASISLGGILSACASETETGTSRSAAAGSNANQVIVAMNTGSEPAAGFDPFVAWGAGEHVHEPLIQSTLFTTDENMEFVNDLATDYFSSEDGMRWTFMIRDDVKFSDGTPLSAEDVAFTINGIISSDASQADLSMVSEVIAVDATTVELVMNKPFNALLYTLAVVGIVPAHAYGKDYGRNPIGSGRYLLEQWDQGQQIILVANPDYYGKKPLMERVIIVFMEEDAALAAAHSGQVDIAFTSAVLSEQSITGYELLSCESVDSRGISLPIVPSGSTKEEGGSEYPVGNDVTAELAIRRAINYVVDRESMIENVLNGHGLPAYSVSDGMPWASPDMKVKTDQEYAKSLLLDDGWSEGSDGIMQKGELRAAINLIYPSGDSTRQALAAEFANQLKQIGIEVSVQGLSWDDIYPHQYSDPILWGWGSNSPIEVYDLNYSQGGGNFSSYDSLISDAYFDEALAQPEVKDSYELWQKAQWDGSQGVAPQGEATWVWLANIDHLYFKRTDLNVADQKPHPHGHGWSLVNNVDQWSWDG